MKQLMTYAYVLVFLAASLGCSGQEGREATAEPESVGLSEPTRSIRMRTGQRLAVADLWKPNMEQESGLDPYQAPLLHLEPDGPAPGALRLTAQGGIEVDGDQPTVYFADERVEGDLRQLTFLWFGVGEPEPQGLRILTHGDGQPALVQVLRDSSGQRVLHVSERIGEMASGEQDVVLAGVFALGFMPTGPYVYQSSASSDVLNVHCRCSPAQVEAIAETREYSLLPLSALEGLSPHSEHDFGAFPEELLRRVR